jgi:hypothetical protein
MTTYRLKTSDGVETFYASTVDVARQLAQSAAVEYGWAYLQDGRGVTLAGYIYEEAK